VEERKRIKRETKRKMRERQSDKEVEEWGMFENRVMRLTKLGLKQRSEMVQSKKKK